MEEKSFTPIDNINNRDLINSLCLFDTLYMTAFFNDNIEGIEQVLRIVMDKPDLKVISVITEAFVANIDNHSVYFDVVAQDAQGKLMDVEVQRSDAGASQKRARFYSSMLDYRTFAKGIEYDKLPESWIIFITEHDVIGKNKPLYHFERTLTGDGEPFGDDSHILYVNGACRDDTPLGKLMHDFACTNADQMYYNGLAERTRYFKESKEGDLPMNELLEKYKAQIEQKARFEGKLEGMNNTLEVISMLKAGKYSLEEIASLAGLSIENVKAIQAKISATV